MENFNAAILSDIHLGHPKNSTNDITTNLKKEFPHNATTAELDIIFLAGDVFDRLLSLPDEEVYYADMWIMYMLDLCSRYDIMLRILDGTKSHDWFQSNRFETIAKIMQTPCDVKYIKDLSIEYIAKFDINVLYVPDEWQNTTDRTLLDVYELLKAKGLNKVDYAIMHGAFDYQLGDHIKGHKHDSAKYLEIVNEIIFIGHIHTHSRHDRIIAQGSFDRLSHGEEEPKGHVRIKTTDSGPIIKFVENKNAKIFKTINCKSLDLEETFNKIDMDVSNLPNGSYVRIACTPDNPILSNINILISRYPLLIWSKLVKDIVSEIEISPEELTDEYEYIPITITNNNIKNLLLDRMMYLDLSSSSLMVAESILNEVI